MRGSGHGATRGHFNGVWRPFHGEIASAASIWCVGDNATRLSATAGGMFDLVKAASGGVPAAARNDIIVKYRPHGEMS